MFIYKYKYKYKCKCCCTSRKHNKRETSEETNSPRHNENDTHGYTIQSPSSSQSSSTSSSRTTTTTSTTAFSINTSTRQDLQAGGAADCSAETKRVETGPQGQIGKGTIAPSSSTTGSNRNYRRNSNRNDDGENQGTWNQVGRITYTPQHKYKYKNKNKKAEKSFGKEKSSANGLAREENSRAQASLSSARTKVDHENRNQDYQVNLHQNLFEQEASTTESTPSFRNEQVKLGVKASSLKVDGANQDGGNGMTSPLVDTDIMAKNKTPCLEAMHLVGLKTPMYAITRANRGKSGFRSVVIQRCELMVGQGSVPDIETRKEDQPGVGFDRVDASLANEDYVSHAMNAYDYDDNDDDSGGDEIFEARPRLVTDELAAHNGGDFETPKYEVGYEGQADTSSDAVATMRSRNEVADENFRDKMAEQLLKVRDDLALDLFRKNGGSVFVTTLVNDLLNDDQGSLDTFLNMELGQEVNHVARSVFDDTNICESAVQMIRKFRFSSEMLEKAFYLACHLTYRHKGNIELFHKANVSLYIVQAMKDFEELPDLQLAGCKALRNLYSYAGSEHIFSNQDMIEAVLSSIEIHGLNEDVIKSAFDCLWNLSIQGGESKVNRRKIVEMDGLVVIARVHRRFLDSETVRKPAAYLIKLLTDP